MIFFKINQVHASGYFIVYWNNNKKGFEYVYDRYHF